MNYRNILDQLIELDRIAHEDVLGIEHEDRFSPEAILESMQDELDEKQDKITAYHIDRWSTSVSKIAQALARSGAPYEAVDAIALEMMWQASQYDHAVTATVAEWIRQLKSAIAIADAQLKKPRKRTAAN